MTPVTSRVKNITRFEWSVPCNTYDPHASAVIADLEDAIRMARAEAQRRGMNTSTDDWCRVSPRDEEILVYFDRDGVVTSGDRVDTNEGQSTLENRGGWTPTNPSAPAPY